MRIRRGGWRIAAGLALASTFTLSPTVARGLSPRLEAVLSLAPPLRAPTMWVEANSEEAAPSLPAPPVKIDAGEPDPTAPVEAVPYDQLPPAPPPRAPPPSITTGEEDPEASFRPAWDSQLLGLQLLGQVVASAASSLTGLVAGLVYVAATGDPWGMIGAAIITFGVVGLILHPLATQLVGHWMHGGGSIVGTLLGFAVGLGGAVLLGALAGTLWGVTSAVVAALALACFYAGPIAGYHLSASRAHPTREVVRRAPLPAADLSPTISLLSLEF